MSGGRIERARVDGVPVFDCHYGTSNKDYSIKIDQLLTGSGLSWLGEQAHGR
jgi:flagellar motor switch protein FliM